jgi:small-conductance mechanosensitive channel
MLEAIQKFTTVAECDAAIQSFVKRQKDLVRRQVNLAGQKDSYGETSEAIAVQIENLKKDIVNFKERLASGPGVKETEELEDKLVTAEYQLHRALRRERNYGRPGYAGKEFDLDLLDYSVEKAAEFIQAVEARKAQL